MVQLPASAAIEYVAAGHFFPGGVLTGAGGAFVRGVFCPGALLAGGLLVGGIFVRGRLLSGGLMPVPPNFNGYTLNGYTMGLGFLCLA